MSRRIHLAPVALASDGSVIVNVVGFDVRREPETLLELARSQRGRLFIGVQLDGQELERVLQQLDDGMREATARIIGRRQRLARKRKKQ